MSCGSGAVTGALDELETPTITVLVRNIPSKACLGAQNREFWPKKENYSVT